jgi:methyl-accepting chemotaxis protein
METAKKTDSIEILQNEAKSYMDALNRVQCIIEFSLDGTILHANNNFLNALGYSIEEIQGKHHRIFCEPEYVSSPDYRTFWEKLGRGEFVQGEFKRLGKNGKEIWIYASYNPIMNEKGQPYKVVKFASDITQQKLLDADFRSRVTAINRVQAVIEFNLNGIVVDANQNFLDTFGYSLEEVKGKHHRTFCDPEYIKTDEYRDFWRLLGAGEYCQGE